MVTSLATLFDTAPVRRTHAEAVALVVADGQLPDRAHPVARRYTHAADEGQGYQDLWYFSDELVVLLANRSLQVDISHNYVGEGLLKLHFRIAGSADLQFPDEVPTHISGPFCGAMIHPVGLPKLECSHHSSDDRWVTVFCRPSLFSNIFGLDSGDLPRQIMPFARGDAVDLVRAQVPLKPELAESVQSLMRLDPANPMSRIWAEAKTIDLICGALSAMDMVDDDQIAPAPLPPREIRRIEEAGQILRDHMASQLSLRELARMVGLNRNKLNAGFKQHFGMTVGGYLVHVRMQRAKELLETRDLQVTEVAFEVGYDFSSNFATSFKRYFGYSPKFARKRIL